MFSHLKKFSDNNILLIKIVSGIFITLSFSLLFLNNYWHTNKIQAQENQNNVLILQQDLNGYKGAQDTMISPATWANPPQYSLNYGQNDSISIDRSGGKSLLKFDLSLIPQEASIRSAKLSLYCSSGKAGAKREMGFWRILKDWKEGTEKASPIDRPGEYGATADYAVQYFNGEGNNVPWGTRGMKLGDDFTGNPQNPSKPIFSAFIEGEGWYEFDITSLVRDWVDGVYPNYGIMLSDRTGYVAINPDSRSFRSSQSASQELRPKLTIIYNISAPKIKPVKDIFIPDYNLNDGVQLDVSEMISDANDKISDLVFSWKIIKYAYGSTINDDSAFSPNNTKGAYKTIFKPDKFGTYRIELSVSNSLGLSSKTEMEVRVLRISKNHPRIWLTPERIQRLQKSAQENSIYYQAMKDSTTILGLAIRYFINKDASLLDTMISKALAISDNPSGSPESARYNSDLTTLALTYDFAYLRLTEDQKQQIINKINKRFELAENSTRGFENYSVRYLLSFGLAGIATFYDNPLAKKILDNSVKYRFEQDFLPMFEEAGMGPGGGWAEGSIYGYITEWYLVKWADAIYTGTGEDVFESTKWFYDRMKYSIMQDYPGYLKISSIYFRNYPSFGDAERRRASMHDYSRVALEILVGRYKDSILAQQVLYYLLEKPANKNSGVAREEEFLWLNENLPQKSPDFLSHFAKGTGTVFMKSSWQPDATYISFQCGDHWTYHQHQDQNSFTIYKYNDLAVESGVYLGTGGDTFDEQYYIRTVAHNSVLVYDPNERIGRIRGGIECDNDGGQRGYSPLGTEAGLIDKWRANKDFYNTGDILAYEDTPFYTYVSGDATNAYSNPHNELVKSTTKSEKLSLFTRSLAYLRPESEKSDDFIVIFDRVNTTKPEFKKYWLLHTINEPQIEGSGIKANPIETEYNDARLVYAENGEGKLFMKVFLPHEVIMKKVGGFAKTKLTADLLSSATDEINVESTEGFLEQGTLIVGGDWGEYISYSSKTPTSFKGLTRARHYSRAASANAGTQVRQNLGYYSFGKLYQAPGNDFESRFYGIWRIELVPSVEKKEDNFLVVLFPTHSSRTEMPYSEMIKSYDEKMVGVKIQDRLVMFSKNKEAQSNSIIYTIAGTGISKHLIVDLKPNTQFTVTNTNLDTGKIVQTQTLNSSDQGILYFTATLGSNHQISIVPQGAAPLPNVTLNKSANKTQYQPNDEITYTITYQNTGSGEAKNVVITDVIPQGTSYVPNSATENGVFDREKIVWTIPSLATGSGGSVSFRVKVKD